MIKNYIQYVWNNLDEWNFFGEIICYICLLDIDDCYLVLNRIGIQYRDKLLKLINRYDFSSNYWQELYSNSSLLISIFPLNQSQIEYVKQILEGWNND